MIHTIRKATIEDCTAIADLSSGLNRQQGMTEWHRPDEQSIKDNFAEVDAYLAIVDDRPVGYVTGFKHFNPHNGFHRYVVASLFVYEEFRRNGIGKALLKFLIMEKQQYGVRQFAIDVMPFSAEACALYESMGFEKKAPAFVNYRLGWNELDAFYEKEVA